MGKDTSQKREISPIFLLPMTIVLSEWQTGDQMKKYTLLSLLLAGIVGSCVFKKNKTEAETLQASIDTLNQLRSELIRRKILYPANEQETFTAKSVDVEAARLDSLPKPDSLPNFRPLSDEVLLEKYNKSVYGIYGLDNREDISCRGIKDRASFLSTTDDPYIASARKVCALIPKELLTRKGNYYELTSGTLNDTKYKIVKPCSTDNDVCFNNQIYNETIKFANQRVGVHCTGFGYGDDLIATATHCFKNGKTIHDFCYVFGYVYYPNQLYYLIPATDVYSAKDEFRRSPDYVIIRVDRPLKPSQRAVLKANDVIIHDIIYMAGHPDGLPLKLTLDAKVNYVDEDDNKFITNLDAFHGNSGSPVFNDSGEVVGMLLRGEKDYDTTDRGCVRYYKPPRAYGEEVLKARWIR